MPVSRTKSAGDYPAGHAMSALAKLRAAPPRSVIGQRLRVMTPAARRRIAISERHRKALCGEEHEPRLGTACELARHDPVIRAKVIIDCLPDDLALQVAHLRWDDFDDQVEFTKAVMRSLAGPLT